MRDSVHESETIEQGKSNSGTEDCSSGDLKLERKHRFHIRPKEWFLELSFFALEMKLFNKVTLYWNWMQFYFVFTFHATLKLISRRRVFPPSFETTEVVRALPNTNVS